MNDEDVERLMLFEGIVKNRLQIKLTDGLNEYTPLICCIKKNITFVL